MVVAIALVLGLTAICAAVWAVAFRRYDSLQLGLAVCGMVLGVLGLAAFLVPSLN